jgi:hypothetical protein
MYLYGAACLGYHLGIKVVVRHIGCEPHALWELANTRMGVTSQEP